MNLQVAEISEDVFIVWSVLDCIGVCSSCAVVVIHLLLDHAIDMPDSGVLHVGHVHHHRLLQNITAFLCVAHTGCNEALEGPSFYKGQAR